MRFCGRVGVIVILAFPALGAEPAPAGEWEAAIARGSILYQRGHYAEAVEVLRQALRLSEAFDPSDPRKVSAFTALASAVQSTGQLMEAERLFLEALEACERLPDPAAMCLSPVLGELASVYIEKRQYAKAEPLLRRAVAVLGAEGDPLVAARLHMHLAALRYADRRYDEAEALYRRSLRLAGQAGEPQSQFESIILMNLGVIRLVTGRPGEALPFLERAVAELTPIHGEDHHLPIKAQANLALALSMLGRHQHAVATATKTRAIAVTAPSARSTCLPRWRRSGAPTCCAAPGAPPKPASSKNAPAPPSPATTTTTSSTRLSSSAPSAPNAVGVPTPGDADAETPGASTSGGAASKSACATECWWLWRKL